MVNKTTHCVIQKFLFFTMSFVFYFSSNLSSQILINEGSNKNYSCIADEDGEFPDWIELYNAHNISVNLQDYSLTDDISNPTKWVFPNVQILPGEFKTIFCSGKDRKTLDSSFINVLNIGAFTPIVGWNTFTFTTPFYWDGISNILINTCSYISGWYSTNSVFNQTTTPYYSCVFAHQNIILTICSTNYGVRVSQRPNIKLNNHIIGNGMVHNSSVSYPAPFGNAYSAAKHQILIPCSELLASGLTAGNISSMAFDVVTTNPLTVYNFFDISIKKVAYNEMSSSFETLNESVNFHTNFKISKSGETIYLFSPTQAMLSSLHVNCKDINYSIGSFPNASLNISLFKTATPSATNNLSDTISTYLMSPVFSLPTGFYSAAVNVSISNPNTIPSSIHYTVNGNDPTITSEIYTGFPINMFYFNVLKAKVFAPSYLPSPTSISSYLVYANHVTPVLNIITDNVNLHGPTGIIDNVFYDWVKPTYVEYFDSTQQLIFAQNASVQIDGGWASRTSAQIPFRIDLNEAVLGDGVIDYQLIPNRPYRTKYNKFYLRNGGNQFLKLPYMDACQEEMMGKETFNYYAAWRPISVFINGGYNGLYELREKLDAEYFHELDNADVDSMDILSLSAFAGGFLRPLKGSVDSFYTAYNAFKSLNTSDTSFWNLADNYFDLIWYNDYIIAETWVGNTDWLINNIKIYRSDKTNYRWRFCLMDMESSFIQKSNEKVDCYFDHINWMLNFDSNNPYINIWQRSMLNQKFKNYFINRFADLMNTSYSFSRLSAIENFMYNQTIDEMPNEFELYKGTSSVYQLMTDFNNNHNDLLFQLSKRSEQVRNHIQSHFSMSGQVDVTLNVFPAEAGKIKINTVFPDSLPWTGVYFNGNPVTITAFPNPGFDFAYWDTNAVMTVRDTNLSINLNITSDAIFNAVFTVNPYAGKLSISELNYHSDSTRDAGDWIEFHNYGNGSLDISGWKFSDSRIYNKYIFPSGTIVQPGERLVLAEDTSKFYSQHPGIPVLGPTGFAFSNSNETLTLSDYANEQKLQMHYDDSFPWPPAADGSGRTLELKNDTLNPAIFENWFVGCIGGSPGGPFMPCAEQIIFSEINYKSSLTADAGDWVELLNISNDVTDISGWKFSDGENNHIFTIPTGTVLPSSGYLVLFNDLEKFNNQFWAISNKKGPFNFDLGSSEESLLLYDNSGILYQSVVYDKNPPWPQGANGNGYTLEIIDTHGNFCDGTNWFQGCPKGSPGGPYTFPCSSAFVESLFSSFHISIFPNPSRGNFTVTIDSVNEKMKDYIIEIFNFLGEKIYSKSHLKSQSLIKIDISFAPRGIYLVKIYNQEKIAVAKVAVY